MPRADRTDYLDRDEPSSGRRIVGDTYLYVLEAPCVNLLKFGRSENPMRRFRQVLDGSPVEIKMLGYCLDPEKGRTAAWIRALTFLC